MKEHIEKNLTVPHRLVCLSDVEVNADRIPLEHNWRRWWPKIELFKLPSPVLYFDLDVLVVGNIDSLAKHVLSMPANDFLCFRPIKYNDVNQVQSSIMAWNGDFSFVYNEFEPKALKLMSRYGGDQRYIWAAIRAKGTKLVYIKTVLNGVYFYSIDCKQNDQQPDDARIIIFCGHPRPPTIDKPWVKDYYKDFFSERLVQRLTAISAKVILSKRSKK